MHAQPAAKRYVIWDFDGTLAYRRGTWADCLLDVIRQFAPEYQGQVTVEQLRPYLRTGYPWHSPDEDHSHLKSADQWWNNLDPVFASAFSSVGIESSRAAELARQVRLTYPLPGCWQLYEDTIPTLDLLSSLGWRHVILSNHVPELRAIISYLGLDRYLSGLFNSAETGYEKPNQRAFLNVLSSLGHISDVWMIGDSSQADAIGAMNAGIPAILVRSQDAQVPACCVDLFGVVGLLLSAGTRV